MNRFHRAFDNTPAKDLEQVVEPLVSYICAMEQPQTALISALAVLFREIEATNRTALAHFRNFSVN